MDFQQNKILFHLYGGALSNIVFAQAGLGRKYLQNNQYERTIQIIK